MFGAFAIGALCTWAALARQEKRAAIGAEPLPLPYCTITVVLVGVDDSAIARGIDATSGSGGWSHVYLDPCRIDEGGARLVIDYTAEGGVHWTDAARYGSRPRAYIELDGTMGHEVYGCVRAKLGAPFDIAKLLARVDTDEVCSGLIANCFPPALRRAIRSDGRCPTPNDIARAFGVHAGQRVRASTITQQLLRRS
jgi:hypothetical protein